MPYKSKAEQEAELWMTLPQAISHICAADHIDDERIAQRELLKALAEDEFRSRHKFLVRWRDEVRISGEATPDRIGPPDVPPRGKKWAHTKIRWASGKVLDQFGAIVNGQWQPAWRTVLLYRSKVIQLWPQVKTPAASPSTKKRSRGPQTKKGASVIEAIKTDLEAKRLTTETLRAMSDQKLVDKYGEKFQAKRTTCREAREAVLTEFDGNSNAVN